MATTTTFPEVRISTDRLTIREFAPEDAPGVGEVIAAQEWEALPPGVPRATITLPRWLRDDVHRFRDAGHGVHLAVQHNADGVHIGAMSLFNTDWKRGCTEVGFGLRAGWRGRGYATEALLALTGWALSAGAMRRIELLTAPGNAAARLVAEKTGYAYKGIVPDPRTGDDMLLFHRSR
ncbi:GNAT family N-acetyltransferase [Luedemannella helvata]|uniref:GNAT family protein n=1 Tax=Luedemannella helvata TaxID=349315 RepID=A0ABP4X8E1_9ACTN